MSCNTDVRDTSKLERTWKGQRHSRSSHRRRLPLQEPVPGQVPDSQEDIESRQYEGSIPTDCFRI